ncbi:MAG: hypothetical protein ND895_18235 [Pyrinomonadaceae bacterium]|nr:hypothetical protein [Pyrinomonadaceae bacterium]
MLKKRSYLRNMLSRRQLQGFVRCVDSWEMFDETPAIRSLPIGLDAMDNPTRDNSASTSEIVIWTEAVAFNFTRAQTIVCAVSIKARTAISGNVLQDVVAHIANWNASGLSATSEG